MIRVSVVFIISFFFSFQPVTAQDADSVNTQAKAFLAKNQFSEAIPLLRVAAEAGHPEAQYNLSVALIEGMGVESDPVEANEWLLRAAEQDWVDAQYKLAYSYVQGRGVAQDLTKGFDWFQKAANNGDVESHFIVIGMLLEGQGVAVDIQEAITWATDLAIRENPANLTLSGQITSTRLNLARIYLNGEHGLAPDSFEAYKWFLITNENKVDFSTLYQQQIIDEIYDLEEILVPEEQTRAREAAENMLGRPLANLENRHQQEM